MDRRFSRRTVLGGLGSAVATASIGGGTAAALPDWQAGAPPQWHRIMARARAEGTLTVGGFPALARTLPAAFERDTGITLNWFGGRPSEVASRLAAEARAGNLSIDASLGGGRELGAMKQGGYLNPIRPQLILPGVAPENYRDGRHKFMDGEGLYLLQGAQWVFGWLLVNKDVIDPGAIRTWQDMLRPEYRGRIIAHDPRSPGPGQGASAWLYNMFGIGFIKDFFLGQNAQFTASSRQVVAEVARGTKPIGFASIQFFVERFRKAGIDNLAVVLPEDAPGYLTGGFSVLKQARGAPHPNAAQVFINWYVSRPGQQAYEKTMMETSRRKDVRTDIPSYLRPRPGVAYYEAYNEERYFSRRPVVKLITEALGDR